MFRLHVLVVTDDIIRSTSDYTLQCTHDFNTELSKYVLNLFWNLSEKAQHMLNSHFITGFQFTMEQIGGDDNVTMYYMNDTNITLRTSLRSNEWYLLVGRILFAGDEESYGPEPFYITFRTTKPSSKGATFNYNIATHTRTYTCALHTHKHTCTHTHTYAHTQTHTQAHAHTQQDIFIVAIMLMLS